MRVLASRLNVRSGPGTDFRVVGSLARGASVSVVEGHGDWAWVEPGEGWVSRRYLGTIGLSVPTGLEAIMATFGEPGGPQASAGRAVLPAPLKLSWQDASVTRFACHAEMDEIFTEVFARIHLQGLWPLLKEFGGCYQDRQSRASSRRSTHSWGIAVDLNPSTNGLGTKGNMDSRIIRIFEEAGFLWGGRWTRPDPMHFQYAKGY